jgi:hypothetical protein
MERLLLVYLAVVAALMVYRGVRVTPDLFFVIGGIAALLMGRGIAFVRDWFPLMAIFLAWQVTRGVAWQAGFEVRSDELIAIERLLHFGVIPTVVLQDALYSGVIRLHDIALTAVYHAHFIIPLALGLFLWARSRALFYRYMAVLLLVSVTQFLFALFVPAAPPRFANLFGENLGVVDIALQVKAALHWGEISWVYTNMIGNPYAAFPSLHAAYPVVAMLAVRRVWPRLTPVFVVYIATVWFAIVYLGHHYLIDAYAGAALALATWWLIGLAWRRRSRLVPNPVA